MDCAITLCSEHAFKSARRALQQDFEACNAVEDLPIDRHEGADFAQALTAAPTAQIFWDAVHLAHHH